MKEIIAWTLGLSDMKSESMNEITPKVDRALEISQLFV